jgi:hypothetical protein
MAIDPAVFTALLALDSYNRGDSSRTKINLDPSATLLGNAEIGFIADY